MPDPRDAPSGHDVIAIGADLEPGTLIQAYRSGLFPMPEDPDRSTARIGWYSPDPRGVIPLDRFHVSRTLRRSMKRFRVTFDEDFPAVIRACADPGRPGRWITPDFVDAYCELHRLGWAHSVEVHDEDGRLVGGVYGVRIAGFFAGESMFHQVSDASKVALAWLVAALDDAGTTLFDVQWTTPHLRSLGAIDVTRDRYLAMLADAVGP